MNTEFILQIAQIVVAVLLIIVVLLQNKGAGLGGVFGGEGNSFSSKRGIEKKLHYATIVLGALFLLIAILNIIL